MEKLPLYQPFKSAVLVGYGQVSEAMANGEWIILFLYFLCCLAIFLGVIIPLFKSLIPNKSKKLSLRVIRGTRKDVYGGESTMLLAKNIGSEDIGIHNYGFRNWNGTGVDQKYPSAIYGGEFLKPEQEPIEIYFYDGEVGRHIHIEEKDILFYFVETGNRVFYLYTIWRPLGYVIRKIRRL